MGEIQRSCLKLQDATGTLFFVSLARHPPPPGEAPESARADLAVTDGSSAWTATGVAAGDIKGHAPGKMGHLLAALSDLEPSKLPYKTDFQQKDGSLVVRVSWQAAPTDPRVLISVQLAPAVPAPHVISAMLALLADNLAALTGVAQGQQAQLREYEKQAKISEDLVERYVKGKEAQDKETNTKVASLLNSKKKKLRELQQQLEAAQKEIQQLKDGGAGVAEQMEADDEEEEEEEEEGASGGRRRLRGGARGAAASRAAVLGDESEDEGSGEEGYHGSPERD